MTAIEKKNTTFLETSYCEIEGESKQREEREGKIHRRTHKAQVSYRPRQRRLGSRTRSRTTLRAQ